MRKAASRFEVEAYKRRLRLLREIISGENQTDFAKRMGMDFKRWNNYERGYPVPREVAFMLQDQFGVSIDWVWWGFTKNMPEPLLQKIKAAETFEREEAENTRALERLQKQIKNTALKRKKIIHPVEPGS